MSILVQIRNIRKNNRNNNLNAYNKNEIYCKRNIIFLSHPFKQEIIVASSFFD